MKKYEVFRSPHMQITIADVHTEEDRKKLTNDIHSKLNEKFNQRVRNAFGYLAGTSAVVVGSTALFLKVLKKLPVKSREGSIQIMALALTPVLAVMCSLIYTIAQGIIMGYKGKLKLAYAETITNKVQEFFANPLNSYDFLVSVNLDDFNPKNRLNFSNGMEGVRMHKIHVDKGGYVVNKIVEAIKKHGLASSQDNIYKKSISKNDPDWKLIEKEAKKLEKELRN